MYYFYFFWFITSFNWANINAIGRTNDLKKTATTYFHLKNYDKADQSLMKVKKTNNNEAEVLLNLGKIYLIQKNVEKAEILFKTIKDSKETQIAAQAYAQLGYIQAIKMDTSLSIKYFKMALRTDPSNKNSRLNLELLQESLNKQNSKKLETNNKQKISLQLESQNLQTIVDPNAKKTEILKRLNKINMNEENANKILLALANKEIQYIQQTKKIFGEKSKIKQDW